jgi:competence protein ComEC
MRDPLLLPLAAVTAGILLSHWLPFSISGAAWPAAAFLALALLSRQARRRAAAPSPEAGKGSAQSSVASGHPRRKDEAAPAAPEKHREWSWLALICLTLSLICAGALIEAWHRPGPPPTVDAGPREIVLLDGCVVDPSVFSPSREQFTLELATGARARVTLPLDDPEETVPSLSAASQPIQLLPPQHGALQFDYGQRVEIEARIRSPHNFNNPGGFDYVSYLARQHIYWTATMTRGSTGKLLGDRCGSRFMALVYRLRTAALKRLERLYAGNEYATAMLEGVLIGQSSGIERVWTENFRRTGTFHALVISGVHVAVLAGVLLFLLRLCGLPELSALAVTAAAAWLYAFVSGLSAPVVRAAGGFSLYLAARFLFRRTRVMNLLAAVALAYLAWDPQQLFDASFQLSFLSVAAIGALAAPLLEARIAPLARGMRSLDIAADPYLEPRVAQARVELRLAAETLTLWTRLPKRWMEQALALTLRLTLFAAEMVVISAVIQVGLALPMAEYFHRVSFTGLTANLLIVPLMEMLVPIGFLAIFTGWHWVAAVAGALLTASAQVADWHARLEPAWRVPNPPLWLALGFAGSLLLLAFVTRPAGNRQTGSPPQRRVWRLAALATVLGLFVLLLWQPWPARTQPHVLELTSIDVGQGDSLLLVFPQGQRMLVDGGGLLQFGRARTRKSNLDIGEDVVSPYLWSRGIRRLDVVVATHAHQDHIGGLAAVLDNFHPRELWTGANPDPALSAHARRLGVRVIEKWAGARFDFSGAGIEILSPPAGYSSAKAGNNDSLAFWVHYGSRSFLLEGDLERPMERLMLSDGLAIHADVLKVGHHGSKTSTIAPFLDTVAPEVAIISAGFQNSFGHPSPEVVQRLEDRHAAVLRTDLDGLVTVSTDGRLLWFDTRLWGEDGGDSAERPWYPFPVDLLH